MRKVNVQKSESEFSIFDQLNKVSYKTYTLTWKNVSWKTLSLRILVILIKTLFQVIRISFMIIKNSISSTIIFSNAPFLIKKD